MTYSQAMEQLDAFATALSGGNPQKAAQLRQLLRLAAAEVETERRMRVPGEVDY
jgi:hypothetical protein